MRIGELARSAGVTVKAIRYYESLGLLDAVRAPNGYRKYDASHLRVVTEIRELSAMGISAGKTAPFIECLALGHEHGDDCVSSLVAYRDSITEIDRIVADLQARRARLVERLDESADRASVGETPPVDHAFLPAGLPVPIDDGRAAHLIGMELPTITLRSSSGGAITVSELGDQRSVIYLYPLTGRPGVDLPEGWDSIPGARGCTTEACDFRDHYDDLRAEGIGAVFGLSSQDVGYQAEVVERLRLPFAMLSDQDFALADQLDLPTFAAPGHERLHSRLTLVARGGRIEHVFYPVFPPNTHAQQVLDWLRANPQQRLRPPTWLASVAVVAKPNRS